MRKHSVRKWLHALLDLLPLVVIPVFMVYSHRHQINDYTVERTEYRTIHMQQNVINGLPSSLDNWDYDNVYYSSTNGFELDIGSGDAYLYQMIDINLNANDIILTKLSGFCSVGEGTEYTISFNPYSDNGDDFEVEYTFNNGLQTFSELFDINEDATKLYFKVSANQSNDFIYIKYCQVFNLTKMFGSGNEPTIDEFNALFPNDYYAVDSNAVAYVPYTRTYNDTDIGSQIFYSLYNSVDKYFNCNKLFSFNGVYNWINFNLFGGNAPLMVDVVYQIIVYEFFMDLIFLIYSVFMFIIDFASNFLEYCFSWSHRGGR